MVLDIGWIFDILRKNALKITRLHLSLKLIKNCGVVCNGEHNLLPLNLSDLQIINGPIVACFHHFFKFIFVFKGFIG